MKKNSDCFSFSNKKIKYFSFLLFSEDTASVLPFDELGLCNCMALLQARAYFCCLFSSAVDLVETLYATIISTPSLSAL